MVLFGPHCWIAISPGTTHIHLNYVTTVMTHSLAFKINQPTSINAYVLNTYFKSIGTFIYIQPIIPNCADEGFTFSSKAHYTALALTDLLLGSLNFLPRSTRHFKFWFRFIGCWPLSHICANRKWNKNLPYWLYVSSSNHSHSWVQEQRAQGNAHSALV